MINDPQKKKLDILFVSDDKYPPFRVDTSILIGEEMGGRGHRIDLLLQSKEPCAHSYKIKWCGNNVWVGRTDNGESRLSRLRKHVYWILHQLRIFSLLRKNSYDLIQVKNKYIIALAAALGARLYGVTFVYWLSYPFAEECLFKVKEGIARYPVYYFIKGHVLTFLVYKIIMPYANHVFVQSEQMKKDIVAKGIDAAKLTPIPMGVSARSFEKYRSSEDYIVEGMKPGKKSIVYLGTIQRTRRMDFMVRVLAHVLEKEPGTVLYCVGDGDDDEDRRVLEKLAESLGVSNSLVITGFLPRDEAMVYVRNADACVSPFYPRPILNSTSPTKLVEYMAMGKAVVANDHPEQRLVLEESGGGICVPYQEEAFAAAVVDILRNPDMAREMGIRGQNYVDKYRTYGRIADTLENSYLRICAS